MNLGDEGLRRRRIEAGESLPESPGRRDKEFKPTFKYRHIHGDFARHHCGKRAPGFAG